MVSPPSLGGVALVHSVQSDVRPHRTVGRRAVGPTGATELCWNSSGRPQTSSLQRRERSSLLQGEGGWGEVQGPGFSATAVSVHVKECQRVPIISMPFTIGRGPTHDEEA